MTRKIVAKLLDFAELCDQETWQTAQARAVFELARELVLQRDRSMIREMKNRLDVREQE